VLALWSLAVAQPLLDLFGKNPEFFVVNELTRLEIVLFAVLVAIAGPVVFLTIEVLVDAIDSRAGKAVHHVVVGLLGTALAFVALGQLGVEDSAIVFAVAIFVGVTVAYLEAVQRQVRAGLRYLAWSPIVFVAFFLVFSPTAELLTGGGVGDVEAGVVGEPAPIVVVSLDEFPVASLLRPDGTINDDRFPNFARLAERTSWYRTATSVSPLTQQSVPATLTGRLPGDDELPTAQDHPQSIFTLLGDAYDQHVTEQVTDVCPSEECPAENGTFDLGRLRTAYADAAAVYAQAAMPPSVREHLPAVDRSWGGFIDDANASPEANPSLGESGDTDDAGAVTSGGPDPSCPNSELACGGPRLAELAESIGAEAGGERPDLWVSHVTVPHFPWIRSATGRQYADRTLAIPGTTLEGGWSADEPNLVRQAFQRHLLQLGYVDRLLGQVLDELGESGTWDETLLVVTADHGISFRPGSPLRAPTPETVHEIYNVPLFIKLPGQERGRTLDENAITIDVLPTIVDALDIETNWAFDGQSLLTDEHRPDKPVEYAGTRTVVPTGFDGVLEVARRNGSLLPHRDDWLGVAAVGTYGDLVGRPVDELDATTVTGLEWRLDEAAVLSDWDPDGSQLAPLLVHGDLVSGALAVPTDALVALNGTVAGAFGDVEEEDGEVRFSALLAEELLEPGNNEVTLLVPVAPGARTFQAASLSPGATPG
jgi:Sulfatase